MARGRSQVFPAKSQGRRYDDLFQNPRRSEGRAISRAAPAVAAYWRSTTPGPWLAAWACARRLFLLAEWLRRTGELCAEHGIPRRGASLTEHDGTERRGGTTSAMVHARLSKMSFACRTRGQSSARESQRSGFSQLNGEAVAPHKRRRETEHALLQPSTFSSMGWADEHFLKHTGEHFIVHGQRCWPWRCRHHSIRATLVLAG
jgi:hypothetical protein